MKRRAVAAAILLTVGCGQRGAPLPPFIRIPAAVQAIAAERVGGDIYLTLVVPAQNIDMSLPVDIVRIEVYGYTGREAPPRGRFLDVATQVATIAVAPPAPEDSDRVPVSQPPPASFEAARGGAVVGLPVTVIDRLTDDELVQGPPVIIPVVRGARVPTPLGDAPLVRTRPAAEAPLRRFYIAIPFSARGRPGPPSPISEFSLVEAPEAPAGLMAEFTEATLTLSWDPSGGLLGFLLDRPLGSEPDPEGEEDATGESAAASPVAEPVGPTRYNVYEEAQSSAPPASSRSSAGVARPVPVNVSPLTVPMFSEAVEFGRERCFSVRAVRGAARAITEGAPSPLHCVTPVDRFPPAAPSRLTAVPAEGSVSLIWEANVESDLAGYLVLRGVAGDATLRPITQAPLTDTRFTDTTVARGLRYVYAVVAVDKTTPAPNVSGESNRVEETRAEP
ncbi:MAG: hypothetical protein ABL993_05685 [Vicinamibacterales bacterium]